MFTLKKIKYCINDIITQRDPATSHKQITGTFKLNRRLAMERRIEVNESKSVHIITITVRQSSWPLDTVNNQLILQTTEPDDSLWGTQVSKKLKKLYWLGRKLSLILEHTAYYITRL